MESKNINFKNKKLTKKLTLCYTNVDAKTFINASHENKINNIIKNHKNLENYCINNHIRNTNNKLQELDTKIIEKLLF